MMRSAAHDTGPVVCRAGGAIGRGPPPHAQSISVAPTRGHALTICPLPLELPASLTPPVPYPSDWTFEKCKDNFLLLLFRRRKTKQNKKKNEDEKEKRIKEIVQNLYQTPPTT